MMGRTHATAAVAVALATLPATNHALAHPWLAGHGFGPILGWSLVPYLAAAAGGAMLPDLDHPQSTASRSLGPVTGLLSAGVTAVSGGHRQGTHSVVGVGAFTVASAAIGASGGIGLALWAAFLVAVGSAALNLRPLGSLTHPLVVVLATVGLAWMGWTLPIPASTVTLGVLIGAAAHVATDLPTREGCPLLWPVSSHRFAIGQLRTGGWVETLLITPLLGVVSLLLLAPHLPWAHLPLSLPR